MSPPTPGYRTKEASMPRFPVTALRSVDLGTPDLDRSQAFYREVWGLEAAARASVAVYLSATGSDHHVVALHRSERPELRAVTFRVAEPDDFAAIAANVVAEGGALLSGPKPNEAPDAGIVMVARG